jgi:hypothetical protein
MHRVPLAPSPARPARRRPTLTETRRRRRFAALLTIVALSACSSNGGAPDGEPARTVGPAVTDGVPADPTDTPTPDRPAPGGPDPAVTAPLDATSTSAPTATTPTDATDRGDSVGTQPEGFTTVTAVITSATGETCEVCLWLADTAEERSRGLMFVTDLGDPVGMAFTWATPTAGDFFMFQTPTPLEIAWFLDGRHVADTPMEPCAEADPSRCQRYGPLSRYDLAVEVFAGGDADLVALGIGPGSTIRLVDGSEAARCAPTTAGGDP